MESSAIIGLLGFIGMFIMVMLGIPIIVAMLISALAGFCLISGMDFALMQFTSAPYNVTASYGFAVVPMFILMGVLAGETGIAESAYNSVSKWLAGIRGGVLMATIGANALFGACCGINLASSVIFAKIALPELEKYGYDKRISMACIATAGILATLIPPSIPILICCILVNISIGRALIGGIIPGILMTVVLALTVWILSIINPKSIPVSNVKIPFKEKASSLKLIWPIVFLFILIIGGMYLGIFPPTVGGAIGSGGIILYALALRIKKGKIPRAFWESVIVNAQIFPLVLSGFIFSRFIALSRLPNVITDYIVGMQMPALGVMAVIIIFYLFMGCVMDLMPILIITLPVVFPLLTGLGFDPYALVIILVFMIATGGITPPFGLSCFVVASAAKVDPMEVFHGVIPFFIASIVMLIILILFPDIVTWLPNLFYS